MALRYVREGIRAFTQEATLPYICSNAFGRLPLVYFLAMRSGQTSKSDTRLGRIGQAAILGGTKLSKAKQDSLKGSVIKVDIHTGEVDDSKEMGSGDTRPTATTPHDENYGQAEFRKSRLATPIKVKHSALEEALNMGNSGSSDRAVKQLWRNATDAAMAKHISRHARELWFGGVVNPTDSVDYTFSQNVQPWPRKLGLLSAMHTTNVYGRVNRAGLPAGSPWLSRRVTDAFAPDIFEVVDEANLPNDSSIQAASDSGVGDGYVSLVLCTRKQFRKYKRQARAQGHKYWPEGIPEMAELGFRREIIQVDNTYVTWDPLCPAGYAACLNLGTWAFATNDKWNFKTTDPASMCDNGQAGGEEADQAFVITESCLVNWSPYANVLFTNIQET
ncbi:MAG TPA: hypothetical protein VHM90_02910 [Phycisphaerae bacterium]|nr:hypothetical protein [Phycisphaerae bacterium]